MDVGYYAPAARTTLNLAVLVVFLREIDLGPAIPRVHTLWVRAGAFRHPAVVCNTTTEDFCMIGYTDAGYLSYPHNADHRHALHFCIVELLFHGSHQSRLW